MSELPATSLRHVFARRPDLLALTPEVLAATTNIGLVKRATRDVAEGRAPILSAEGETILAICDDGAQVRFGQALGTGALGTCSCGALVCRHRIAAVLAFRAQALAAGEATPSPPRLPEADDAAIAALLGPKRFAEAIAQRALAPTIEVIPADADHAIPTARLAGCIVRFLSKDPLVSARCDCVVAPTRSRAAARDLGSGKEACAHIALALWAFRAFAEASHGASGPTKIQLHAADTADAPAPTPQVAAAPFEALVAHLARAGVVGSAEAFATVAGAARTEAEQSGSRWLALAVAELVAQVDAYAQRSARYDAARVAAIVGEIGARVRASRATAGSKLPAREILGIGLPGETRLERTRLISLGARLFADGDDCRAEVLLVEPETGTPIVFEKTWDRQEILSAGASGAPDLGRRTVLPRISLATLAEGQLVTEGAVRGADGTVRFLAGRSAAVTSVLPQAGTWGTLAPRLVVRDFAAERARRREGPPRFLGPRTRTESLVVLRDFAVSDLHYATADQAMTATLTDKNGAEIFLVRRHTAIAPNALPILMALLRAQSESCVMHLSGDLRLSAGRLLFDPLAISVDGKVHVLDTGAVPTLEARRETAPDGSAPIANTSINFAKMPKFEAPLEPLSRFVSELLHSGLGRRREEQRQAAAKTLHTVEARGYVQIAQILRRWIEAPESPSAILDLAITALVASEF